MRQKDSSGQSLPQYFSAQVLSARRFHLRSSGKGKSDVEVVGGGLEKCRPDYVVDRPGFPYPLLEFVAEGAGSLVIKGNHYSLVPGSVFTYGRKWEHCIRSDPHHPLVKYFMVFKGRGYASLLGSRELSLGTVMHIKYPERVRQIFDDLIGFGLGDRTDREVCCAQAARYLLMMISDLRIPSGQSVARAFATYERCRQYIEKHWLHLTSIGEVAEACHVDKAYLCRLFQRFGRERPLHYLQHVRMNYAMTQLQTSDRLIKDIADEMNFSDAANFTRTFRRWFGVPPQSVRH